MLEGTHISDCLNELRVLVLRKHSHNTAVSAETECHMLIAYRLSPIRVS